MAAMTHDAIFRRLGSTNAERFATIDGALRLFEWQTKWSAQVEIERQSAFSDPAVYLWSHVLPAYVWEYLEHIAQLSRPKPAPRASEGNWEYWLADGHLDRVVGDTPIIQLVDAVKSAGYTWCDPDDDPFRFASTESWLERNKGTMSIVADHLEDVSGALPEFESDYIAIVMIRSGRHAVAWIGDRELNGQRVGVGVALEVSTGEPIGRLENDCIRTAAGCALAWLIDCTVPGRRGATIMPMLIDDRIDASVRRLWRGGGDFSDYVRHLRSTSVRPAYAHWRVSHVRRIAGSPSPEKVATVPPHLKPLMGPNHTWVKGGPVQSMNVRELVTYLQKHSMLANAVGSAIHRF